MCKSSEDVDGIQEKLVCIHEPGVQESLVLPENEVDMSNSQIFPEHKHKE
jgi:hypothetical protein